MGWHGKVHWGSVRDRAKFLADYSVSRSSIKIKLF